MSHTALLRVDNLTAGFTTETGYVRVIENITFHLAAGRTLGLVGESGCGKSVTAQTIMRLLPSPPARLERGRIMLGDQDLAQLSEKRMQKVRGDRIGMVFQEPMTSLNPTQRIGRQVAEPLLLHRGKSYVEAKPTVLEMLEKVGIGNAGRRLNQYPHELSGGLRQRVMIALAVICKPALLIADEPTTALDVTIQAQIMELLKSLQRDLKLAILLITHDLGMVAEMCDDVAVMYAGRIVEHGPVSDILKRPRHPYTDGLLRSSPRRAAKGTRLNAIPGLVPPPGKRGAGCSFAERCQFADERCRADSPPLVSLDSRKLACWRPLA